MSLIELIKSGKLIEGLSERELSTPEGVGFDLCVASLAEIQEGSGSLRVKTRRTPDSIVVNPNQENCFLLAPGKTYLATTVESFNLPTTLAALFFPRTTLFRSGILFQSSVCPPGYDGPLTFSLTNTSLSNFELEVGARFAHTIIVEVSGEIGLYKGQWQGGRTSQPKDEVQI